MPVRPARRNPDFWGVPPAPQNWGCPGPRRRRTFGPMHVLVHQRITDPERFQAQAEAPGPGRPPHWRLIASVPTRDGSACFSLWWTDSAEALRDWLERARGAAGPLECHEVDEDNALGLGGVGATIIRILAEPRPGA